MSTGANLENTSLSWLDKMDSLGDGTVAAQNAVLATSVEQMLGDLRGTYQKIVKSDGKFGNYEAKQLQNRIENTTELLPPAARKRLTAIYERDLAVANELGKEAGVDLDKELKNRSEAQKANAAPNVPGQKAAGRRLRVFWEQENSKMTDRVRSLTQQAALQGKSWRSLSLQIRELLVEEQKQGTESERSKRVNKKYGINGRAELIARTEMANAFVQGKIDEMRRMGYEYARWSAAAERTCGYCMSRDGLVYKIEEVEGSIPAHPRCRCSLIPVEMSAEMKKNGPTGPGAADELDDAYWTKSRNDKLSQWKRENRGIRDPKTENLLNQMLRDYARTPTNTQNYLRPGQPAPPPFWAPSGTTIPNLDRAARNAEEASEAESKARKAELEREAEEALKAAEAEAKRIAAAKQKEADEAAEKAAKAAEKAAKEAEKKAAAEQAKKDDPFAGLSKTEAFYKKMELQAKANQEKANKGSAQFELDQLALETKALSQKALTGKLTKADKARLDEIRLRREQLQGKAPVEKIERLTDDVDHAYVPKDFGRYGYKNEEAFKTDLGSVRFWTETGFVGVRNAQLRQAQQRGETLTAYEKSKVKKFEKQQADPDKFMDTKEWETMANGLERIVEAAPKYEGTVYRGMHSKTRADAEALINKFAKGHKNNTLESWSADREVGKKFTWEDANDHNYTGGVGILFTMKNKKGAPIASQSGFATESEVLQPSGQTFKVKKVKETKDKDGNVTLEVEMQSI